MARTPAKAKKVKSPKNLERYFKGVSNHRRIQILLLVASRPGITMFDTVEVVGTSNFRTVSEHLRRLAIAGLIEKKYQGREVQHELTPYGKVFVDFIRKFSNRL